MLPAHAFDWICSKHLHPKCIYLNANSMESSGTMFKAHVLWIAACHKPHFWLLVYYGSPFTLFCWFLHPQRYNFLFKVWFLKKWFKASPFQKVLVKTGVPGKEADPLLLEQASPLSSVSICLEKNRCGHLRWQAAYVPSYSQAFRRGHNGKPLCMQSH